MSKKSNIKITILFVLSVGMIVTAMTTYLLTIYYRQVCFHILVGFCESIIEKNPDSRQTVLELLKTQDFQITGEKILSNKFDNHEIPNFGYYPSNLGITDTTALWIAILVFLAGSILFLFSFWYWHRKSDARIQALTKYLERINTGVQGLVLESSDDEFSKLQDEIYKTVTELYQTREEALTAQNNFSENLSNIAHQLKTPITSISLTVQMAKEHLGGVRAAEIERQINRLLHLEEALLLLSRIDAGTLAFDRKPTDVFTILSLASDNLYELFMQKGVLIDIPEMGEMNVNVDINWTMEAVMNLMKNCLEATGIDTAVHCSYEKNPLYVQIRIWDEVEGF
ncbi:MAG: HAMP domain-containing histidine kinase [Lachnospiraceae bacterium]|nr:HAMP domain-containing histidine kinase [Lachnospiraceae bacterium]